MLYCATCSRTHNPKLPYDPSASKAGEFIGRTEGEAKREARAAGWKFRKNECYCARCK